MSNAEAIAGPTPGWVARTWPECLAALIWLFGLVWLLPARLNQDIAYQLWIARQLNGGIDFYGRIPEVNPPLWYWMAQAVDRAANILGWPPSSTMMAATCCLIALSLGLSAVLIRAWPAWQRAAVLLGMLAALVIIPLQEFEQREHLCIIAVLPYALLIARRSRGELVDWRLALAIGLLAAPFLAFKHYFVVVPLLLDAWLLWQRKRAWRPVRPETLALVAVALAYAVAIVTLESDYLTKMVPLLQAAYGDFRGSLEQVLLNRSTVVVYLALPYLWLVRKDLSAEAKAVLIVVLGFGLAYALQSKGWQYQLVPIMAGLVVAIVLQVVRRPGLAPLGRLQFGYAVLLLGLALAPAIVLGRYDNGYTGATRTMLASLQKGDTAMILSSDPQVAWPMMEELGLTWPSRYGMFWMLKGVANRQAAGEPLPPALAAFVDTVRLETVSDLACHPPALLIDDTGSVADGFDILGLFRQEPAFAALFTAYERQDGLGPFEMYRRVRDIPAGLATDCVTIY